MLRPAQHNAIDRLRNALTVSRGVRLRRASTGALGAFAFAVASLSIGTTDVRADMLRASALLSAPGLAISPSVLPTPWWVKRHAWADDAPAGWDNSFDNAFENEWTTSSDSSWTAAGFDYDSGVVDQPWLTGWTLATRAARLGAREHHTNLAWTGVSFDLKRQLLSDTSRGSLALGFGWALIDADRGARATPRLSLEGRLGISKRWSLYGQSAWLSDAGDFSGGLSGDTLEAGLSWQPTPTLSLRAGYRRHRLRLGSDTDSGSEGGGDSSSIILGAGFRF